MFEIVFSLMHMFEEVENDARRFIDVTVDSFSELTDRVSFSKDNTYYDVSIEKTDDYIYFVFNYGNPFPRDNELTNIHDGSKKENQRRIDETELNHQAFFLYHYEKQLLYVSNSNKKAMFVSILSNELSKKFFIKHILKNEEEFISLMNKCTSIKFTQKNNVLNYNNRIRQGLMDLTGTDVPEVFTIEAIFHRDSIIGFVRELIGLRKNYELDNLIICGLDESNFEVVYNIDTFNQKLKIKCSKDHNSKFNIDEVCRKLIEEINCER